MSASLAEAEASDPELWSETQAFCPLEGRLEPVPRSMQVSERVAVRSEALADHQPRQQRSSLQPRPRPPASPACLTKAHGCTWKAQKAAEGSPSSSACSLQPPLALGSRPCQATQAAGQMRTVGEVHEFMHARCQVSAVLAQTRHRPVDKRLFGRSALAQKCRQEASSCLLQWLLLPTQNDFEAVSSTLAWLPSTEMLRPHTIA